MRTGVRGRGRGAVIVLGAALGIVAVAVGALWLGQRRLVYLPATDSPPAAGALIAGARDVTLRTSDGLQLTAWYVPAPPTTCRATVLAAPGNAGNRAGRVPLVEALVRKGFGVLLLEYRGYGGNPGSPSEQGLAADALAARDFLVQHEGLGDREILYFGESLGSGVVSGLARTHPPAGLALRSPFVDLASAAATFYPFLPVRAMLWDEFEVLDVVAGLDVPVTVVYGTADSIIPPEQSRAVGEAARDGVLVAVDGADHNDPDLLDGTELIDAIAALADRAGCPPGA